jgi:hypothetical protein
MKRLINTILITLFSLAVLALTIAFFINRTYSVSRSIVIYRASPEVFNYISLIRNQEEYSVWAKKDLLQIKKYTGTDGAVGFTATWDSKVNDIGKGELEIKKITPNKRIDMELRFIKPFKAVHNANIEVTALDEEESKVTWSFEGSKPYPMNLVLLFMNMEKIVGDQLNASLVNLKAKLEAK